MMLALYKTATTLGAPAIQYYLKRRMAEGKEDQHRFSERKGKSVRSRPDSPLIWLHAASVGESLSMLPLIDALLASDKRMHLLMTTGTVSSAGLMEQRLPERAFHQYVPVDRATYVRRFLDHWKPDLALWAESEFWPNLILETQRRGVPMILVNGRISPKSFDGWQRFPGVIGRLLRDFALCLGQTDEDADRLRQLGAPNYKCLGNLKFAVPALPADTEELIRLEQQMSGRPRWLAASTHSGEEEIVAEVHKEVANTHTGLLSILVPRHPTRGSEIADLVRQTGLSAAQRSKDEPVTSETDIYIADSMGELGLFFRLSDIAFMGKSLVPLGGQNPLEALRLECAVIHGPHMANFQKITEDLAATESALRVEDSAMLSQTVGTLLSDDAKRGALIQNGVTYMDSQAEVVGLVTQEILSVLKSATGARKDEAA